MTIARLVAFCGLVVALAAPAPSHAYVYWTSSYSGYWHQNTNWSCYPYLPGSGDNVVISVANTIYVDHSQGTDTINRLTCDELFSLSGGSLTIREASTSSLGFFLTGGTLYATQGLSMNGAGHWTAGTIGSPGSLTNNGVFDAKDSGLKYLRGSFINNGTVNHTAPIDISSGGRLTNNSSKLYKIKADTGFTSNLASGTIDNYGALRKESGTGVSSIHAVLNNRGLLDVLSGSVELHGGGSLRGDCFVDSGSTLRMVNRTTTAYDYPRMDGGGAVTLTGGTLSLAGGCRLECRLTDGFKLAGGTIEGLGWLINRENAEWISGWMNGVGCFRNESNLTITGTLSKQMMNGSLIDNFGYVTHTGSGGVLLSSSSLIGNNAGAYWTLWSDAPYLSPGGDGRIINNGTWTKDWSYGISAIEPHFTNYGYIDVQRGGISLQGGGTFRNCGLNTFSSANLSFSAGSFAVEGEMHSGGSGSVSVNGGTLSLAYGATARFSHEDGFRLFSGTVTGYGNLITTWNAHWYGGTVTGECRFGNEGNLIVGGTGDKLLQNAQFHNLGTITHNAANNLRIDSPSFLSNTTNATYDFRSDSGISGSGYINNSGTFRKAYSYGTSVINTAFNNQSGAIDVQAGRIRLAGGGTFQDGGASITGWANLDFYAGNFAMNGTFQASAGGVANLNGGTIELFNGAQARFGLEQGLKFGSGAVKGSGSVVNTWNAEWTGGTVMGSANLVNQSQMTLTGAGARTIQGGRLDNTPSGSIIHTGTTGIEVKQNGTIENRGTYECRTDAVFACPDAAGALTNTGTFIKDWSNGTTAINFAFNNYGPIAVRTGVLRLARGGNWGNCEAQVVAPARLDLAGGTFNLSGEFSALGTGSVTLGGTLSMSIGARARFPLDGGLTIAGGTIAGPGAVIITSSGDWIEGTLAEEAVIENKATFTLSGSAAKSLNGGHLVTYSQLNHSGPCAVNMTSGSSMDITSAGTYDILAGGHILGSGQVNNGGLFRKLGTGGTSVIESTFNNQGTVKVSSGKLVLKGPVTQVVKRALTGGTWVVNNGCALDMAGVPSILVNAADVTIAGNCEFPQLSTVVTNAGTLRLIDGRSFSAEEPFTNSGTLQMDGGEFHSGKNLNTGTWYGWGSISGGLANRGTLRVETWQSGLSMGGSYTQEGTGVLEVTIAGKQDWQFSRMSMAGNASLAGTLRVHLAGGFKPQRGDIFRILTCRSRTGAFDYIDGHVLDNGLYMNAIYTSDSVVLIVGDYLPTPTEVGSPAVAKQQEPNAWISLPGIVSAVMSDGFFVQDAKRIAGVRVTGLQEPPTVGQRVHVAGQTKPFGACVTLESAQWFAYADTPQPPQPFYIGSRQLGGAPFGQQGGVWQSTGLNNVGLLVRVSGRITHISPGAFVYIDDGSHLKDGNRLGSKLSAVPGVRIILPPGASVSPGAKWLTVTGISYRTSILDRWQRAVLARSQADIHGF